MRALRLTFAGCFALIAAFLAYGLWAVLFRATFIGADGNPETGFGAKGPVVLLFGTVFLILAMASWTVLRGWPSGRGWGLAGSCVIGCLGLLMLFYDAEQRVWWQWPCVGVGLMGIVAFWPARKPAAPGARGGYDAVPGDGTHPLLSRFIWVLIVAAAWFAFEARNHWASARGLEWPAAGASLLQLLLAMVLTAVIHEGGHALAGESQGMKLRAFIIGPLCWRYRINRWTFGFHAPGWSSGSVSVFPSRLDDYPRRKAIMLAAGPAANLITGGMALCMMFLAVDAPWEPAWSFLSAWGIISLLVGVGNLIPFRTRRNYSDGAKLWQVLRPGLWQDYHRVLAQMCAMWVSPLRPRDFDLEAIGRVAGTITHGGNEVLMRLCAETCLGDRDRLEEASAALREAEAAYEQAPQEVAAELHRGIVYGKAVLDRDAVAARMWWARMEAKQPPVQDEGIRWLALTALLWVEGRLGEAEEALLKAEAWAKSLPACGAGDVEREAVEELRGKIVEARAAYSG